jgi:hypothetical protein
MSSKMRKRHERGLGMAEAITERTGKKIEKSIGRSKNVQSRSRAWEDINRDAVQGEADEEHTQGSRFGALMEDEDEDEDEGQEEDGFNPANPAASKDVADTGDNDDDEIL